MENISKALVALQAELKPVDKSADNPFFKSKYAPLPEVMESLQPLLAKHKLAVIQPLDNINGEPAIRTVIVHDSGETIEALSPLLLAKQDPQSHGSAITYARRYGVMSAFGLVADEDDDGNHATQASGSPAKSYARQGAPATEKQLGFIRRLAEDRGVPDDQIDLRLSEITTAQEASDAIEKLTKG